MLGTFNTRGLVGRALSGSSFSIGPFMGWPCVVFTYGRGGLVQGVYNPVIAIWFEYDLFIVQDVSYLA